MCATTSGPSAATTTSKDHDWLLKGDVFTPDVIETWIAYKRERELAPVNLRPVPYEFFLYFDL
jgi:glutamine synthetase